MACGCTQCQSANPAEIIIAETSNPGPVGVDTGVTFKSPRTGTMVRIIARAGEPRDVAISRVKRNHGVR